MSKSWKIFLVFLVILPAFLNPVQIHAAVIKKTVVNNQILFNQANLAYRHEDFETASSLYEKIIQNGVNDAVLFYNLGNSYYKLQKYEYAILFYERALKFLPSDKAIRMNLKLARLNILDKEESVVNPFSVVWATMVNLMSVNGWLILGLILLNLFFLSFILPLLVKERKIMEIVRKSRPALIGLIVLISILSFSAVESADSKDRAVMIEEEIQVMGSPSDNGQNVFLIHKGTTVRIMSEANGWANISVTPKLNGWVKTETFLKI